MPTRDDLLSCDQILGLAPGASLEAVRRKAWWKSVRFSFDEAGSTTFSSFVTMMSYGLCAWAFFLGTKAAFDALPDDVGFAAYVTAQFGAIAFVALGRR